MDRRSYLGALASAGVVGAAGCLGTLTGDDTGDGTWGDGETILDPPERSRGDPDVVSHPIHGQTFPDFTVPDALTGSAVSRDDFVGDRAFLMTFIFTSCTDECGTLVRLLQLVQADAAEQGYGDDIGFLSMTFDPETDGPEELEAYGTRYDVDQEAGNWHFLRPETQAEALSLVNDTFGSPVQVTSPDEHDHDDHGEDGHDHDEDGHDHGGPDGDDQPVGTDTDGDDGEQTDESIEGETTTHYYMIFLVNDQGVVERSYPSAHRQRPVDIIDDVRPVVE